MKRRLIVLCVAICCALVSVASTRFGRAFSEVREVSNACESFRQAYGTYPPAQTWFVELTAGETCVLNKDKTVFASLLSTNDPWGTPYVYRFPGRHSPDSFDFYTLGADKLTRTDGDDRDDISSWHKPGRKYSYGDSPIITPLRLVLAGLLAATFLAIFVLRKRRKKVVSESSIGSKMAHKGPTALLESAAIQLYYLSALVLCSRVSYSYFIVFVITPFTVSLAGLIFYRNLGERVLSWLLFALAIIGLAWTATPCSR